MKFHVGYQADERFKQVLLTHAAQIGELYFPWDDFTTGRGINSREQQRQLENDLTDFAAAGIKFDLLLNGNCYGRQALSRTFYQRIGDTVDMLGSTYGLNAVTTASVVIAKFLKNNFPELKIRASVNMEIGTPEGVEYLLDLFDSFYLKREYNQDLAVLTKMKNFCTGHGKQLFILANSGCLNFCSARTFHDNLVAHQHEVSEMDNAFEFPGLCHEFLAQESAKSQLLSHSNFIRPEDVALYENLCDGMKLATRTNPKPAAVASAYFNGRWHGNILDLTEPAHARHFLPEIISNDLFPADYASKRFNCSKKCESCSYCCDIQKQATVKLTDFLITEGANEKC